MKCSTCEIIVTDESDTVFERGYLWHRACFRGGFPAAGKLIPPTIQTVFPEPAKVPSPRRQ